MLNNTDIGLLPTTTLQKIGEEVFNSSIANTLKDSLSKEIREMYMFKEFVISKKNKLSSDAKVSIIKFTGSLADQMLAKLM